MDFGMPTLLETNTLCGCAGLCKELGLKFIELNMNLPQYQLDTIDTKAFLDIARQFDIYYTIHLDESLNPCDFNPLVRKAYVQTALETIKIAKALHVPVINMHLPYGVYFTLPNEKVYLFDTYMDTYIDHMRQFRNACEREIGDSGLLICVENTNGYHLPFAQKSLALLLESEDFALTFDIGHNHCIGGGDEQIILHYREKLRHMHMHDASFAKSHLTLGDGDVDIKKYMAMARELKLRVVLETKTVDGLRRSAAFEMGL